MSAKMQFLTRLQARRPPATSYGSKSQADIALFCQRMAQLQEQMETWLSGTGLNVESQAISVTDLLVEGGAFDISGIILRYEDQIIKFMPIFLYGQGVTGCVEASAHTAGCITPLGRLSMRSGNILNDWTFNPPDALSRKGQLFDEGTFFRLILALLP